MKKRLQRVYIGLFLLIIGMGSILNLPKLVANTSEIIQNNKYDAWAILIGLEYNDTFWNKYSFINLNGYLRTLLGQREMNGVIKLDCGKLVSITEEFSVYEQAQKTIDMYSFLQEEGINFAYIQMPYEVCKYDPQLPTGIEDYSNTGADVFISLIEQEEIPLLDMREEMHKAGFQHYEAFYQTDHHWKTETAFWAYTRIGKHLEEVLGVSIPDEYTRIESWNKETIEQCMLGSNGRVSSLTFGGLDDITLMYPKFDVNATLEVPMEEIYREGDFKDTFMDYSWLEGENLYEMLQYNVYIGEDWPLTQQKCENAPIDKKILVIKDSYFRPVQAFLGTVVSQIDTIDMRVFDGDVKEYIRETKPDMVLLCYNPFMLQYEDNFLFEK